MKKIFDKKFVHFMWDDSLEGKEGFVSDSIDSLVTRVNSTITKTIDEQHVFGLVSYGNSEHPFSVDGIHYKFFYYDPLYDVKLAWKQGKQIQVRDSVWSNSRWFDTACPEWNNKNLFFRMKPEKTWRPFENIQELKKVWGIKLTGRADIAPDYKLTGPMIWIRSKANSACIRSITGFIDDHDVEEQAVAIGSVWTRLDELFKQWEFLDGTPLGVEE